mgnify:CR=1 FL=1
MLLKDNIKYNFFILVSISYTSFSDFHGIKTLVFTAIPQIKFHKSISYFSNVWKIMLFVLKFPKALENILFIIVFHKLLENLEGAFCLI